MAAATAAAIVDDDKLRAWRQLDAFVRSKHLVELHTHLMGMGSADFWLHRIMETYLPRACPTADWTAQTPARFRDHLVALLRYQLEVSRSNAVGSVRQLIGELQAGRGRRHDGAPPSQLGGDSAR